MPDFHGNSRRRHPHRHRQPGHYLRPRRQRHAQWRRRRRLHRRRRRRRSDRRRHRGRCADRGAGDDTFFLDDLGDTVFENAGEGSDLVYTSVSYGLGNNVERLAVNGFATTFAITLNGNELDNEIWGNDGANYINGCGGRRYPAWARRQRHLYGRQSGDVVIESRAADRTSSSPPSTICSATMSSGSRCISVRHHLRHQPHRQRLEQRADRQRRQQHPRRRTGADIMQGNGGDDYYFVTSRAMSVRDI